MSTGGALYRVDVRPLSPLAGDFVGVSDARGAGLLRQAAAMGIGGVASIETGDIFFLQGDLDERTVTSLTEALLCDPNTEEAWICALPDHGGPSAPPPPDGGLCWRGTSPPWRGTLSGDLQPEAGDGAWTVEVAPLPGVTDSVAESLLAGARMAGFEGLRAAATGQRYVIRGELDAAAVDRLATGLLANGVIQAYAVNRPVAPGFAATGGRAVSEVETIPVMQAGDGDLGAISRSRRLALDIGEMRAIQAYFRTEGREPTDVELEMLAQTWSEHCVHKTFRALIDYEELEADGTPVAGARATIDSLLNSTIRAATEAVAKPWVLSAFVDNAGIVAFDENTDVAFKVETHNHPSALEPFGGANTGVGGVIRDVIGVSARPIAATDILCFGRPDADEGDIPAGVLHPRRIADGVTAGIEDYGNKMGIPTVNGAILYAPGYVANPLVFCGCVGTLPHGAHRSEPGAGDLVVVIGGRTGRDGLRGATFSSMEMDHETGQVAGSAVQIGHPIHEKQVLEAVMIARDEGLYSAITDCGAGGLSSAVGEMARSLGAAVHLERVPLKYAGLQPWEIWLSEAQERMVLAVPAAAWPRFRAVCEGLDVEATALGEFTGDGILALTYKGRHVGRMHTGFLHDGMPRRRLQATWVRPERGGGETLPDGFAASAEAAPQQGFPTRQALAGMPRPYAARALLALLALPDIRSKEDVVRRYDHEVQGGTVVRPFVGRSGCGPADAAVLAPLDAARAAGDRAAREEPGIALAAGINPAYGALDPYAMAWAAVDEAMRNCVAVGADPDRIALLDNFCWGNPNLPDRLGSLVRCAQGCHDAAVAYAAPFVSGKDSLNNEYTGVDGQKHAIPGTLLISALGFVPDVHRTVTSDLKRPGDLIYVLGVTAGELGGSALMRAASSRPAGAGPRLEVWTPETADLIVPPQPVPEALALFRSLHLAMRDGTVRACHDVSEGGLAVAAAEMALGGELGMALHLADAPRSGRVTDDVAAVFCESSGRFLVEVAPEDAGAFEARLAGLPCACAGEVCADGRLRILGLAGAPLLALSLDAIERAWRGHLGLGGVHHRCSVTGRPRGAAPTGRGGAA